MLLDDWRASINDQLHQAADEAISRARAAQTATIAPIQQAAQQLPQIQTPDPGQVGAALHSYVDQLGQQAGPAVIQVGQNAADAAQQVGTQVLGGAQQAQAGISDALHQHVDNLIQLGGGNAVQQVGQPPVLGGTANANTPTITTLGGGNAQPAVTTLGGSSSPGSTDTTQGPTTPIDASSPGAFARSMAPYAQYAAQKLGIDPTWVAAMAASESNYGKADAAGHELFGVKALPGQAGTTLMTHEGENGGTNMNQSFAAYDSAKSAVDAWVDLIQNHYKGAVNAQDLPTFIHGLKQGGYFTAGEGEYLNIVKGIGDKIGGDVQAGLQAVGAAPKGPTVATTPPVTTAQARAADLGYRDISQFGDSQLTSDEAYAACGPAAAVRFAEKFGRNPTLREATDLAKTVGWTSGGGMAGIASEQKLMSNLGVDTKVVGRDWAAYAQEAQTGNPVTISTPGHYYFADGYNPESGAFHVGRSGLDLKGGSEWMTPAQMENLMGQAQGALFANNPTVPNRGSTTTSNTAPVTAGAAPATLGGSSGTTPGAVNVGDQQQKQPPPIIMGGLQDAAGNVVSQVGGAASSLGSAVRSVADDLGQAAQGVVQGAQQLNQQTPGQVVVNQVTPVLGGAASDLGSNVRRVADQAAPVLGAASDTAQNVVLRQGRTQSEQAAFEEGQRQVLGQLQQSGQKPAEPINAGDVARNAWDLVTNSNPGLPGVSLSDYQHASTVKNDWIQKNNPAYNLPGGRPGEGQMTPASVLGDLTTAIAQQITDPLSMTQFGLLGNVGGGAVGGAVGGRVAAGAGERLGPAAAEFLGKVTERLVSGGITGGVQNALYAAEQPGASPESVGIAALQGAGFGAALEGGFTAAGPVVRRIGQSIIDRAPELRTATAEFARSEVGAAGRPEDVAAERARQVDEAVPVPRGGAEEPIRTLPGGGDTSLQRELPGMPAEADTAARARQGVDNPVDMRRSQQVGRLVNTLGEDIGPNDTVTVYHATTPEVAASLVENGFQPGVKQARNVTTIQSPAVARSLGKNVGDPLDYEPGRGQGQGVYFTTDPRAARDVYGSSIVAIDVPRSALEIPPERQTARMTPERALLLGDGYTTQPISPDQVRLVNTGGVPLERPAAEARGASEVPGVGGGTPSPETGFRAPVTPDDLNVRAISQQQARQLVGPAYDPSGRTTTRPPEEGGEATPRGLSPMAQRFADQYLTPSNAVREFDRAVAEGRATPTAAERAAIDELRTTPDPPERVTPRGELPQRPVPVELAAPVVQARPEATPRRLEDVQSNPHLLREPAEGETPMTVDERQAHQDTLVERYQTNQDRLAAIEEQLANPKAKPERPPWAAGFTNDQVATMATKAGRSPYEPLWWEKAGLESGSGEVRDMLNESGINRGDLNAAREPSPAELRQEQRTLRQDQQHLEAAGDQLATAPEDARFAKPPERAAAPLPFEHATVDPGAELAKEVVTTKGTLTSDPNEVTATSAQTGVKGRGIVNPAEVVREAPSAETKALMPNLNAIGKDMPETAAQIQKSIEDNQALWEHYKQGTISFDSLKNDLARRVGMTKEDWLKTKVGQAFNDQEMVALQAAMIEEEARQTDLAKSIMAKGGVDALTPEELAYAMTSFTEAQSLAAVAKGAGSTSGRSLNARKVSFTRQLASDITAANERKAAQRTKAQATRVATRADDLLQNARTLEQEKASAATPRPNQAGAPRTPQNIIDQIAAAYDELDKYNALSLHEKASVFNKLQEQRAAQSTARAARVRGAPEELLAQLQKELKWEQNNFAKRKDTWETMAFQDSKVAENAAAKRAGFRGGLYIEQERKVANKALDAAQKETDRAFDAEMKRRGQQSTKAQKLLESMGGQEVTKDILKNYLAALNDPDPVVAAKFLQATASMSNWKRATVVRLAGLVSSPITMMVNLGGNAANALYEAPVHALAGGIDAARVAAKGGERQIYSGDLLPMMKAYGPGFLGQLDNAKRILTTGFTPEQLADPTKIRGAFSRWGALNTAVEAPLRILGASDALFRGGAMAAHGTRVAMRQARAEGFSGPQVSGRAATILKNLEDYPELAKEAADASARQVYQERRRYLGGGNQGVDNDIAEFATKQFLPFYQTPMNVTAQGVAMSPLGGMAALQSARKAAGMPVGTLAERTARGGEIRLAEERAARALIGTGILGAGLALGSAGHLTGGYPLDQKEASTLPQGWRPWSVKIDSPVDGNTYYVPMQNFNAAGFPLAMAAILTDPVHRNKTLADPDEQLNAVTGIGRYVLDNTFLQGISDLVNTLHDPKSFAQKTGESLAASYGPYSSLGREFQRVTGVATRNPREGFLGLWQAMEANYPGASGQVPAAQTPLGDERTQGATGIARAIPARYDIERDEPTLKTLREHGVGIPPLQKSVSAGTGLSIKLTEEEQAQLQQQQGALIRQYVADAQADKRWAKYTDNDKAAVLKNSVSAAQRSARAQFLDKLGDKEVLKRREARPGPEPYYLGTGVAS